MKCLRCGEENEIKSGSSYFGCLRCYWRNYVNTIINTPKCSSNLKSKNHSASTQNINKGSEVGGGAPAEASHNLNKTKESKE